MVMLKYQQRTKIMIFLSLILIAISSQGVLSVDIKKLYYEKDISEYCKRRVIPSIFLGRHVVEASSSILHFTKLTLPYSCYISIRAESGSNLIMALMISNVEALEQSCSSHSPQLLVYEIGETFGGYWGMLPEVIMKPQPPQKTKYYTLKTTQSTTTTTESTTVKTDPTTSQSTFEVEEESPDFIEVPIVEASGHIEPGSEPPTSPFDAAEAFDYLYDVTPIPGVKYDTIILPLVQLSVENETDIGVRDDDGSGSDYELEVTEEKFTPDPRLTLPRFTPNTKHRIEVNRLIKFKKTKVMKNNRRKNFRTQAKVSRNNNYIFPTKTNMDRDKVTPNSWEIVDTLIKKLRYNNVTGIIQDGINENQQNDDRNISKVAENIWNLKHNYSIYLQHNLSVYDIATTKLTSKPKITLLPLRNRVTPTKIHTVLMKDIKSVIKDYKESQNVDFTDIMKTIAASSQYSSPNFNYTTAPIKNMSLKANVLNTTEMENHSKIISQTESNDIRAIRHTNRDIPPVSLVDHESFENILQAAPKMALLLNQTVSYNVNKDWPSLNETHRETSKQKKRSIQAIAIENDRPHNITTRSQALTTTKKAFNLADMQEFERMVELKDDEVLGRISLRYLKQYVGPAIYNICGNPNHHHNRHVFLFNSSRVVLSLQKFSMSSVSVVFTGAQTLLSSEMRCSSTQLECQVSGARVCVDALAACDGVPNCGSYDIYDEDRSMCAVALGIQRHVYLAAFTFIALMLTLCYAVHYWLRRCVPHVAEAFFVYTDGVENILYLDSVMRAPGDTDTDSKMFFRGSMLNSNNICPELTDPTKIVRASRSYKHIFRKMFPCFKKNNIEESFINDHELKKTFSFTQMELCNISQAVRPTTEISVQTGESLELATVENKSDPKQMGTDMKSGDRNVPQSHDSKDPPIMIYDSLITLDEPLPEDELSLIKFFRDARLDSYDTEVARNKEAVAMDFSTGAAASGEKEISSIVYDALLTRPGPSGVKAKTKVQAKVSLSRKHLRFDDTTTIIPTPILIDEEDEEQDLEPDKKGLESSSIIRSWRAEPLGTIREDDESAGRHRHFWESKKKKSKKTNVSLR